MLSGNDVQNAALQAAELDINLISNANSTLGIHKPFEPEDHDLDPTFRLTRFSEIKTRGTKVQQDVLNNLLKGLKLGNQATSHLASNSETVANSSGGNHQNVIINKSGQLAIGFKNDHKRIEIGSDACILPLKNTNLSLIESTNTVYMLVDDPYVMGKIACSNVLSNLYALGITRCDNMLMMLNVSYKMTDKERDTVVPIMIRGFRDCALEAGTTVTGGHTMFNPWLSIGGTATSILHRDEYIIPDAAVPGDVLVLTKPLGTQIALLAYQWLDNPERWNRIKLVVNDEDVHKAYLRSLDSMARLNVVAANLMHKFKAHAATDIGGFGLLGHADYLAKQQKNEVSFVLHNLPVINKLHAVSKTCGNLFSLFQGTCPETSGGLLIVLPREQAAAFCKEIEKQEGYPAWIVGVVEKGDRSARIIDKPRIIDVPATEKDNTLW